MPLARQVIAEAVEPYVLLLRRILRAQGCSSGWQVGFPVHRLQITSTHLPSISLATVMEEKSGPIARLR